MRTGGLISDFLGEVRIEELQLPESQFFVGGRVVSWKAGRFEMGYPLGMPLGIDAGISFQVYAGGALALGTGAASAVVSVEPDEMGWFEILGVASHLRGANQSNVTDRNMGRKVRLEWPASASSDTASYLIYQNPAGWADYNTPVGEVDAKPGGIAPTSYSWTSGELAGGTWTFGIRAVDEAGNIVTDPACEVRVTLTPPPYPPLSLECCYDADARAATLAWTEPTNWT